MIELNLTSLEDACIDSWSGGNEDVFRFLFDQYAEVNFYRQAYEGDTPQDMLENNQSCTRMIIEICDNIHHFILGGSNA